MAERAFQPLPVTLPRGLFYGWMVVAVSMVTNVASTPVNPLIFSIFATEISDDTGWSRSAIALALTFRLLTSALATPIIGPLVDRHGSRWLNVLGAAIVGLSLLAMSQTTALWAFYLLFALTGAVGLGAPGGAVLTQVPPARWFVAKRGRALSITAVGLPAGTVLLLPVATLLQQAFEWRVAWAILGVGVASVVIPLNVLFMRRAPEDHGLRPDGAPGRPTALRRASDIEAGATPAADDEDDLPEDVAEVNWTAREAARTSTFWIALAAFAVAGLVLSGTLIQRVAFWEDEVGMSRTLVAVGIAFDPFSVIFLTLLWGWVADRMPVRLLGVVAGGFFALSMIPMLLTHGEAYTIFVYSLVWGVAGGAYINLNNLLWPSFFGRTHLGAIRGIVVPVSLGATALGAPLYGLLLDGGVEFRLLWVISAVGFLLSGLLLFLTPSPGSHPPPRAESPVPAAA